MYLKFLFMNDNFKQWQIDTGQDLEHVMRQKNVSAEDLKSAGICQARTVNSMIGGRVVNQSFAVLCDVVDFLNCKLDVVKNGD